MGLGDTKGTAANTCLGLAAGEEVLGWDAGTELALPLAIGWQRGSLWASLGLFDPQKKTELG